MDQRRTREARLVLRAQAGDRQAASELLALIEQPLYRHLRGMVGEDAAHDALQDCLLHIFRKLTQLKEPRWFRAWCFRIASRRAYRLSGTSPADSGEIDLTALRAPPSRRTLRSELGKTLDEVIDVASPKSREVLLLHYEADLTLPEIGEALGVPVGTVKSRLAYGIDALRQKYADVKDC